jgi:peptidoglycan/LPS O-acetylase OafA/YrhL
LINLNKITRVEFRNDINLLRAISVLSVVLYHADFKYFKGGWLGVDIFFVISGFLISNIIISELIHNEFSFKSFYIRRLKRILPALFFILTISLPFAYELLTPKNLISYSDSLISSILFYSNYYLQNLDFYTSLPAKLIPNLHIWSLSIEEQFYLIFPLTLFIIYKFFKEKFVYLFGLIFLFSLLLNSSTLEIIKFYQLQFRVWEFLLGMFCMLIQQNYKKINISPLGILLILFSILYFGDDLINNIEPKLIAVIGTGLILISEDSLFLKGRFNNLKIIGSASFSIYLLHQPVFSFLRIYLNRVNTDLSLLMKIIATTSTIIFSIGIYTFIEKRFIRNSLKYNLKFLLICAFIISSFSFVTHQTEGMKFRYDVPNKLFSLNELNSIDLFQDDKSCNNRNINNICIFQNNSPKDIYTVGDSLLKNLYGIAEASSEYDFNYFHYTSNNCLFIFEYKFKNWHCPFSDKSELDEYFSNIKNSVIIYGGRFPFHIEQSGFDNTFVKETKTYGKNNNINPNEILNTLEVFLENKNTVVIIYPIPEQAWIVSDLFLEKKFSWKQNVSYPQEVWEKRKSSSYELLNKIQHKNLIRIYPDEIFCDSFLPGECVSKFEDSLFFYDELHFTLEGQELVSNLILDALVDANIIEK